MLALILFIAMLGLLIVFERFRQARSLRRQIEPAREAYYAALDGLRDMPHDRYLRQKALSLGRHYWSLAASRQSVTARELSISNDIAAACAGGSVNPVV